MPMAVVVPEPVRADRANAKKIALVRIEVDGLAAFNPLL